MKILFSRLPEILAENSDYTADPLTIKSNVKPYAIDFSDGDEEFYTWVHNNYDEDTVKYAKLLECDLEFEKRIKEIRKEFELPEEGYEPSEKTKYSVPYSAEIPWKEQFAFVSNEYEKIEQRCIEKFKDYKIPYSFKRSLPSVVVSNYIDISSLYSFYFEKDNESPKVNISIEVFSPMQSCNKIKKDLDLYWDDIVKLVTEDSTAHLKLPEMPTIEIWNIRNRLGWSYKKVAKFVGKRYRIDLDESEARKRMDYMRKQYKKIAPVEIMS